ncbi:D-glycero-alpha-D-manno-heptose-1,7-bisphosphate 7-phosphatase [Streptomyces sp. NPDC001935]|uniref:D-glycero-alpha-D-manno-heptose-1,7-bisphosphate 7-phosphatase n=1 Tax=Streptomyces sp. NPDC056738 TaxID=3345933 RepID=UPI003693F55F
MTPDALLLDRDGVLNTLWHEPDLGTVDSPHRPDQVRLMPGAAQAVRRANEAGVPVIVASNQPGIAKGKFTTRLLTAVTGTLLHLLAEQGAHVDHVYYCLHHPEAALPRLRADCANRKPAPGLLREAIRHRGLRAERCWFVGDTPSDIAAGRAAGCRTAWVGRTRCDVCPTRRSARPDLVAPDLMTAVTTILEEPGDHREALPRQRR